LQSDFNQAAYDAKIKIMEFGIVSLLFDVNDYRPLNSTAASMWKTFWDQLDIEKP
jgi:hypothetical protein